MLLQCELHLDCVQQCCLSLLLPHAYAPHVSTSVNFRSITEQSSYCPKQGQCPRSIHADCTYELLSCSHDLLKELGLQGFLPSSIGLERWRGMPVLCRWAFPLPLTPALKGSTLKQLLAMFGYGVTSAPHACLKKSWDVP